MDDQGVHDNNARHKEALAQVEAFKKSGGKIKQGPVLIRKIEKSSINLPSRAKPKDEPVLKGLSPVEKFKAVLNKHKELTRQQLSELTGLAPATISRCARELEDDEFITRGPTGLGHGREVSYKLVKGK